MKLYITLAFLLSFVASVVGQAPQVGSKVRSGDRTYNITNETDVIKGYAAEVVQDSIAFPVDTTALKLLTMDEGRVACLKQLSSTNTNGGGWYVVRDSTGIGYEHLTAGLEWQGLDEIRYPRIYNVLDYGFVADGSTENGAAFESLLSAMLDSSTMYFPGSNYEYILNGVEDTLTKDIIIKGDGIGRSIINGDTITSGTWLRRANNLIVRDIEFRGFSSVIQDRWQVWEKDTLDHCIIQNTRFYDCKVPFTTGNQWNADSITTVYMIINNIVDQGTIGFAVNNHYKSAIISGNSITNLITDFEGDVYGLHIGNSAMEGNYSVVISNNIIDSIEVNHAGSYSKAGMFVYANNAVISGNTISNIHCNSDGAQPFTYGIYTAGKGNIIVGNKFYNASYSGSEGNGCNIYTKGKWDNHTIINGNEFYGERDSIGYYIHNLSPSSILNNVFVDSSASTITQYCIRARTTETDVWGDSDLKRSLYIGGNKFLTSKHVVQLMTVSKLVFNNNEVTFLTSGKYAVNNTNAAVVERVIIKNNEIVDGGVLLDNNAGNEYIIKNNEITNSALCISLIGSTTQKLQIENNTIVLDTTQSGNFATIEMLDSLSFTSIKNNRIFVRSALTSNVRIFSLKNGDYDISNNTFHVDSVADSTADYSIPYQLSTGTTTRNFIVDGDKFLGEGHARLYIVYGNGYLGNVILKNLKIDAPCDYAFNLASGTLGYLEMSGWPIWEGSALIANSGTITQQSVRQIYNESLYFLSEYVTADSLYKIYYDFDNTRQDTFKVGLK